MLYLWIIVLVHIEIHMVIYLRDLQGFYEYVPICHGVVYHLSSLEALLPVKNVTKNFSRFNSYQLRVSIWHIKIHFGYIYKYFLLPNLFAQNSDWGQISWGSEAALWGWRAHCFTFVLNVF